MPGHVFELGGNPALLQALAGDQRHYQREFESIMGEIMGAAGLLMGQWQGAGAEGFRFISKEAETAFQNVQTAFNNLSTGTETCGENWGSTCAKASARFLEA